MAAAEGGESRGKETLLKAIVVADKLVTSKKELGKCVALAFPEQLVMVGHNEFAIKDTVTIHAATFDETAQPKFREATMSWMQRADKGVHVLRRQQERRFDQYLVIESLIEGLIDRTSPGLLADRTLVVKWSVIDTEFEEGLLGKPRPSRALVIAIYSPNPPAK